MRAQIVERKAEILTHLRQRLSPQRFLPPPIQAAHVDRSRAAVRSPKNGSGFSSNWNRRAPSTTSAALCVCMVFSILPSLEASFNAIVIRHETLRTAFRLSDGKPVQVVQPTRTFPIDFTDLRSVQECERETRTSSIESKPNPYVRSDLQSGLLLRCTLLCIGDEEHILVLLTHHSASDAWSMGILTRELWTLYDALSNEKAPPLKPLPVQYSDYAVWQRDWLQSDVLEIQLSYWKEQLKDLPVTGPADRSTENAASEFSRRSGYLWHCLKSLTRSVNEISHRFAVTPFMTLLAAFQILLFRYTGQEDFGIGSLFPIAAGLNSKG